MKRQIILSLVIVFALALFAPAVVSAMDSTTTVEMLDNKDKKVEKKAEKKAEATTEKKADCTAAKSESSCSGEKAACCSGAKKAACTDKKAEKK